jgi:FkbM family methyltransferase
MLFDINPYIDSKINGIIQVGAHLGNEYDFLSKLSTNILMFEPQKQIYEKLLIKLGPTKGVKIENIALGSEKKTATMFVEHSNGGQSSSLLMPALHLLQYPSIKFESSETVNVTTLDEYFNNNDFNYNLITLDVQGYELEVLKGAKKTLEKVQYLLCEVNRAELYKDCPMVEQIDEFLKQFGFERIVTSWDGQTWGDAFYKKK